MDRAPGVSVRLKLTLSYAGFVMLAGALLLAAVWLFLLRYAPDSAIFDAGGSLPDGPLSSRAAHSGRSVGFGSASDINLSVRPRPSH